MAKQTTPVVRNVALKVIKPGMDTNEVVRRFEVERQTLALMDHPQIASVLDAGTTESGHPYFVMEFVHGLTITEYCVTHRLTIKQRLNLFTKVCSAIEHAHQKGVIHRDIKPSNILVATREEEAYPKVIDFGVAKALEKSAARASLQTSLGQVIGTPQYMSPEQSGQAKSETDTRSDVYSLGVLLYELLTGHAPLDEQISEATHDELLRIIRDEVPPVPSTRVGAKPTNADCQASSNDASDSFGYTLRNRLRGDLDWIVMKAIEKEPDRRFQSVFEFSEDIRRHLAGEPVESGPPMMSYRLGKFARRNRGLVITSSFSAAAVLLGLVISAAGWNKAITGTRRANDAAEKAETERSKAIAETHRANGAAEKAKATVEVLFALLDDMDPGGGKAEIYRVSEMFDDFSENLESSFPSLPDQPEVAADVHRFLALGYKKLGRVDREFEQLQQVVSLVEDTNGEKHEEVAKLYRELAGCASKLEREVVALELVTKSISIFDALNIRSLEAANARAPLCNCQWKLGRPEEAERAAREGLSMLADPNSIHGTGLKFNLIPALRDQGKLEEAISVSKDLLNLALDVAGEKSHGAALARHTLAMTYAAGGELEKAEEQFRLALPVLDALFSYDTFYTRTTRHEYYKLLRQLSKFDVLFEYFGRERRGGEFDLMSEYLLASTYLDMGDYEKALELLEVSHAKTARDSGLLPTNALQFLRAYVLHWTDGDLDDEFILEVKKRAREVSEAENHPIKNAIFVWTDKLGPKNDGTRADRKQELNRLSQIAASMTRRPDAASFIGLLVAERFEDLKEFSDSFELGKRSLVVAPKYNAFYRIQLLRSMARSSQTAEQRAEVRRLIATEIDAMANDHAMQFHRNIKVLNSILQKNARVDTN